jgi:argininosuccinate lyase
MMPQKRNPDMLELIRGKSGAVYGALVAMLTILKAQPSTYNRDLQEDKIHVFTAADYTDTCLQMTTAIVSNTTFNTKRIADGLDAGFLDATALAEYLVRKGIPFRQAHGIVGSLVAQCEDEGKKKLDDLTIEQFKAACNKIEQDVYDMLDPAGVCKSYQSKGAAGPQDAEAQIHYWKGKLKEQ